MPSSHNITYLLGAGASYNSIPLVDSMNDRIQIFLTYISNGNFEYKDNKTTECFREVFKKVEPHISFDTYAKKLYLQKDTEGLFKLKALLCCFFEYEQYVKRKPHELASMSDRMKRNNILSDNFNHLNAVNNLDMRYDAFLAAFLEEKDGRISLPKNINIVSWNYDSQFEIAYKGFVDKSIRECRKLLNIHPWTNPVKTDEESSIIKLNGSSYIFEAENNPNESVNEFEVCFKYFVTKLKQKDYSGDIMLKFAWENNRITNHALDHAKEILKHTHSLVVIGYSFPFFNRKIDEQIFSECQPLNVWINAPLSDFESYKESIQNILPNKSRKAQIRKAESLKQFYIPMGKDLPKMRPQKDLLNK